jgi:hypothetical protein
MIYLYEDITFAHTKFDALPVISCAEYAPQYTTVSLFHGMTLGSVDTPLPRIQFTLKDFNATYRMFGAVNKMQFLDETKKAFYTGSLIQQTIEEDPMNHGLMIIDTDAHNVLFHPIKNVYCKMNLIVNTIGRTENYYETPSMRISG